MTKMVLNKWINGAIPALLLHVCIGSVYCWSLLKDKVSAGLGISTSSIEIAFSLAIFFLGMSAAFCGRMVEKDVKKSAYLSTGFFVSGLLLSCLAIFIQSPILFILSYGVIMGIGLGIGYLTPVKTLMIWFNENQGLAAGIAIAGFGLSKVLFSPFIEHIYARWGIYIVLLSIALISAFAMGISAFLIAKPIDWVEVKESKKLKEYRKIVLKSSTFKKIWVVFFINITCGLAVISFEKDICAYYSIPLAIAVVSSISAIFNTLGRIGFATLSDYIYDKSTIYFLILIFSFMFCFGGGSIGGMFVLATIWVINLGYGGGFSSLPPFLVYKFGVKNLSSIHGLVLSAWGVAGLCGNSLSDLIINGLGLGYGYLFLTLACMYFFAIVITLTIQPSVHADY